MSKAFIERAIKNGLVLGTISILKIYLDFFWEITNV